MEHYNYPSDEQMLRYNRDKIIKDTDIYNNNNSNNRNSMDMTRHSIDSSRSSSKRNSMDSNKSLLRMDKSEKIDISQLQEKTNSQLPQLPSEFHHHQQQQQQQNQDIIHKEENKIVSGFRKLSDGFKMKRKTSLANLGLKTDSSVSSNIYQSPNINFPNSESNKNNNNINYNNELEFSSLRYDQTKQIKRIIKNRKFK
ncbi:unnamed protein product [[Candida] boidinii]|nr:unnamed protein product [[Candida] boidinii]